MLNGKKKKKRGSSLCNLKTSVHQLVCESQNLVHGRPLGRLCRG